MFFVSNLIICTSLWQLTQINCVNDMERVNTDKKTVLLVLFLEVFTISLAIAKLHIVLIMQDFDGFIPSTRA